MIDCDDLVHVYGERTVLHGVTLHVPRGEIFGFIGPNGAGKTTTIRVLATLLAPTSGRVRVGGHDVVEDPAAVRRIMGYMPDLAGVYEHVTGAEYLDFFASAFEIPRERRARTVANVVELTEIGGFVEREVVALSKGQKQRLMLARTLLHDPQVLILDEPASDLDPRARIELRMLLAELGRMGKTIFLSSHILTELADICTSIGIIHDGRVIASGPIAEVQARLRPGQRVMITVLSDPARAEGALGALPFVREVTRLGDGPAEGGVAPARFEVAWEGERMRLADIVRALVEAGVAVVGVAPEGNDLERIFMDVTERAV